MYKLNCKTKDFVLYCGDIHGKYDVIPDFLKKYGITNAAIIQAGDFGLGWGNKAKEERQMNHLSERLAVSNSQLFAMRGNHDRKDWFKEYFSTGYVHLIPDYTVLNINEQNILFIGGAVSVDRSNRKEWLKMMGIKWWLDKHNRKGIEAGWWEDEVVVYNTMVEEVTDIDVVVSHTAPSFSTPFRKTGISNYMMRDTLLVKDLDDERRLMTKIYKELTNNNNIRNWYYGHFHKSNTEMYMDTQFQLLDINEIVEHKIR